MVQVQGEDQSVEAMGIGWVKVKGELVGAGIVHLYSEKIKQDLQFKLWTSGAGEGWVSRADFGMRPMLGHHANREGSVP